LKMIELGTNLAGTEGGYPTRAEDESRSMV